MQTYVLNTDCVYVVIYRSWASKATIKNLCKHGTWILEYDNIIENTTNMCSCLIRSSPHQHFCVTTLRYKLLYGHKPAVIDWLAGDIKPLYPRKGSWHRYNQNSALQLSYQFVHVCYVCHKKIMLRCRGTVALSNRVPDHQMHVYILLKAVFTVFR